MPGRCLTTMSPVVTRLLIRSARSTRLSSRNVRSWVAVTDPLSMTRRRSRSWPARVPEKSRRSRANERIALERGDLALQHGVAVADQGRRDVEVPVGGVDERRAGVDDALQVGAGPGEGQPELVDGGAQGPLVHRPHRRREVAEQLLGRQRDAGVGRRDLRAVVEVGAVVGLRLEVDVLLTDGRAVADHGQRVGRDLVVPAAVDVEVGVDPVAGEHQPADLADADPAVGDHAAGVHPAGVAEVRHDRVRRGVDQPVQLGVLRPDEAHPEQRDQGEDEELDLRTAQDHRLVTSPGTSRLTSVGS